MARGRGAHCARAVAGGSGQPVTSRIHAVPITRNTARKNSVIEQPEPVELGLREIAAADEDDVLAAALRRDHREVAAREQQRERHQRRGDAAADAHVEEDAQQGEHLRRLAHEHVVDRDVEHDQRHVRHRPRQAAQVRRQPLARVAHEAELVQLPAQREQHREPEKGGERVALRRDVVQRQHVGHQQQAEPGEGDAGHVELQRVGEDPARDHQHERHAR